MPVALLCPVTEEHMLGRVNAEAMNMGRHIPCLHFLDPMQIDKDERTWPRQRHGGGGGGGGTGNHDHLRMENDPYSVTAKEIKKYY